VECRGSEDDVAGEQRLVAAVAIDQHARCHVRGVVDDDDAAAMS